MQLARLFLFIVLAEVAALKFRIGPPGRPRVRAA